jgi:hypothetical protein
MLGHAIPPRTVRDAGGGTMPDLNPRNETDHELLARLADELRDKLYAISEDHDHETKIERAEAIVRDTPHVVTALVMLAQLSFVKDWEARSKEYEAQIAVYDGILAKLGHLVPEDADVT